ncbi:MAG: hypothetical protein JW776_04785 [Candidatus Lokiarchaeota archaeon]|nr:hypothetical protein [Candidatus Lokiarchaeota archaeon]
MKKLYVYILIATMICSSAFVVTMGFTAAQQDAPFVVGTYSSLPKLDPQDQYDSESAETIGQVCEGLYRYNYSSPEMESIPQLAAAMGSLNGDNYTVTLREDVTFHDGTPFNASAVKWTFDRIQYFSFGLWVGGEEFRSLELMESYSIFAINEEPILNTTVIDSEFQVTFVLNTGAGFWEKLLAFMATQIMLPDEDYAYGEKFTSFLSLNDHLVGTGPFEFVQYIPDTQVEFVWYEDYYLERPENFIKRMIYLIVPDDVTRSLAILNYEIHWGGVIADYADEFAADPNLIEVSVKTFVVFYIQMNMENMPFEARYASARAWNHTYMQEERLRGRQYYLYTAVPDGMLYHATDEDIDDYPYFNLTLARETLLGAAGDLGTNATSRGLTIANETADWVAVAESTSPIAWYNFTGYEGLAAYYTIVSEQMKQIGIRMDLVPLMPWATYLNDYLHDEEGNKKLTYSFGGWGPDYNDPINMIEPLYGSGASANCFLLSDATLDGLISDSYNNVHPAREQDFFDMQELLVKELVPSWYIYQRGGSLAFNQLYVDPDTIDDMKNPFSDYYWFNVQFFPPEPKRIPGFELFTLLGVALGVTLFLVLYLRKRK